MYKGPTLVPFNSGKHLVFVYGTLKTGHYNNRALTLSKTSKLIFDDAFVKGQMYDLGPYPAVVVTPGSESAVKGEVWEVDDETLARLDHLEGHPTFYLRQKLPLLSYSHNPSVNKDAWQVWVYTMQAMELPAKARPMSVGNWPIKR